MTVVRFARKRERYSIATRFANFRDLKSSFFLFSIQHCNYLLRATCKRSPSYFATNEMILIVCGSRSLTSHAKVSFRLFFSLGVTSFPSDAKSTQQRDRNQSVKTEGKMMFFVPSISKGSLYLRFSMVRSTQRHMILQ